MMYRSASVLRARTSSYLRRRLWGRFRYGYMIVPWNRATSGKLCRSRTFALRQHAVHLVAVEQIEVALAKQALGPARRQHREQGGKPHLLVQLARDVRQRQPRFGDRWQLEEVEVHAVELRWLLHRRAVVMVGADGAGDEVHLVATSRVALQRFVEGRGASLAGEGPDLQRADHEDAKGRQGFLQRVARRHVVRFSLSDAARTKGRRIGMYAPETPED